MIALILLVAGFAAHESATVRFGFLLSFGAATLLALLALLGLLIGKLGGVLNRWRLATFGIELLLVPVGYVLTVVGNWAVANAGTPTNPGTDGPFADGLFAALVLMGSLFWGCGLAMALLLLWEAAAVLITVGIRKLSSRV